MASKLFKASPNQSKIIAAMDDPVNIELVKQLDEYIGDEYKDLLNPPEPEADDADVNNEPEASDNGAEFDEGSSDVNINIGSKPTPLADKYEEDLEGLDAAPDDSETDSDEGAATVTESATQVGGKKVMADTAIINPPINLDPTLRNIAGEIKGTLNARTSTAGVSRVNLKNDELWVYYNDDINLNNVMDDALSVLSAINYTFLVFNRLARTDNAIVFTIEYEQSVG